MKHRNVFQRITRPLTCRYAEEPEPQGASDKKRDAPLSYPLQEYLDLQIRSISLTISPWQKTIRKETDPRRRPTAPVT